MGHVIRFLAVVLCATVSMNVHAARHALVIGNDSYAQVTPLKNARADAKAVAKTLEAAGFRVTLALDQSRGAMNSTIRRFKASISGGDEAVFFYAGHGVQLGGANYLLPIDMHGDDEDQVKDDAIQLQRVLDDLAEQKARFSLAIIDACRDNPFKGKGRNFGTRGLAPTSAANGQMVIFSAGAGQQALDRLGDADKSPNGLFTRVLLGEIARGGQPVDRALKAVRTEVVRLAKSVGHDQVPAIYDQSVGDFYFRTTADADYKAPVIEAAPAAASKSERKPASAPEQAFWDVVSAGNTVEDYEAYLEKYPEGRFAADARRAVASLNEAKAAASEKDAWAKADKLASADGFRTFLKSYPDSAYAALAQIRLRRLDQAKAKELADCPSCPTPGDVWEYEFVDGITGPMGQVKFTIQSVSGSEIVEAMDAPGLLPNEIMRRLPLSGNQPGPVVRQKLATTNDSWWLMEPNLYNVLTGKQKRELRKGDRLEMSMGVDPCLGEVVGDEEIQLPVGRLKALKVKFYCSVVDTFFAPHAEGRMRASFTLTVWVDSAHYRLVKLKKEITNIRKREYDELRLVKVTRAGR